MAEDLQSLLEKINREGVEKARAAADEIVAAAKAEFTLKFGHAPKIYDVVISDGARKL